MTTFLGGSHSGRYPFVFLASDYEGSCHHLCPSLGCLSDYSVGDMPGECKAGLLPRPSPYLLLATMVQGSVRAEGGHIYNLASVVGGEPIYTGGQIILYGDTVNLREGEAKRVSGDSKSE